MSWHWRMIDPTDLETRFSNEDALQYMDSIFTEPSEEDLEHIKDIESVLDKLPPREVD